MKIDNFFSDDAYKWAFFAKSAFFDLFAWKMLKKVFKNQESIGCSKRFLSIFATFEKWPIYYCFASQNFFQLQNNNKWIQKSSKSRFIIVLPLKIFFERKKITTFSKSPYESLKSWKFQKLRKKWKSTTFFQMMPINEHFSQKVLFLTFLPEEC